MNNHKLYLVFMVLLPFIGFTQFTSLPVSLSLPFDKDTIEEHEPTFVWQTNLAAIQNDIRLSQQIAVVKLEPNQTSTEAIIENQPVFVRADVISNTLTYSSTDQALEDGNTYAWQITYLYNGMQVQQSEVSTFVLAKPEKKIQGYYPVRSQIDNSFLVVEDELLYVSVNETLELNLQAELSNSKIDKTKITFEEIVGDEVKSGQTTSLSSTQTRYFRADLTELNLDEGFYTISWKASNKKTFYLNIEIIK